MFLPLLRSLFARRGKHSEPVEQRDPGWKLFGKVPPREGPTKDPRKIQKVETRRIEAFDRFLCGSVNGFRLSLLRDESTPKKGVEDIKRRARGRGEEAVR